MAVAQRRDPYLSFRFTIGYDPRHEIAGFSEITGLTFETEVETFREGGVNYCEQQLAGPTRYPSKLVLKHGLTHETDLWDWYQKVANGRILRKNIIIRLLDSTGRVQRSWSFREACPVKWSGPDFRAGTAEIAFETVELVHKGLLSI